MSKKHRISAYITTILFLVSWLVLDNDNAVNGTLLIGAVIYHVSADILEALGK